MAILQTEFSCPNGHSFTANAKLRARCPTCGAMARVDFTAAKPKPATEQHNGSIKEPVLLKQGKAMPRRVTKTVSKAKTVAKKATPKGVDRAATRAGASNMGSAAKPASGLLKTHTGLAKGTTPKVTGKPPKTAIARHIEGKGSRGIMSYVDTMMERAGFGR